MLCLPRRVGSSPTDGTMRKSPNLAFIIGIALGDGNLSNPNGRATRLRITCDNKYPEIIKTIIKNLKSIIDNKISIVKRKNCVDISCYSNKFPALLGWKEGSKKKQQVIIPKWIFDKKIYMKNCLRGLILTDGSVYIDRGYLMVNFVTSIDSLAKSVKYLFKTLKYNFKKYKTQEKKSMRYTFRLSTGVNKFIKDLDLYAKIKE